MKWGGSLGRIVDAGSQLSVEVRSFGSFEGTVPAGIEERITPVVLDAVRTAVTNHQSGVLADPREVANAAQAIAAPRLAAIGVHGEITVAAVSVSADDHERILGAARASSMRVRAERMAARSEPAVPPAGRPIGVGAEVLVRWSDGQHYKGTVREVGADQVQVSFANGATHWIPLQYVSAA